VCAPVKTAPLPAKTAKTPVPEKKALTVKKDPAPPKPKVETPVSGGYIIQVAALSSRSRADALASKVGGSVSTQPNSGVFRVRIGPFATKSEADQKLASVHKSGHPTARVFRE